MKRRDFVQKMGMGMGLTMLPYPSNIDTLPSGINPYSGFKKDYQSILSAEGFAMVRIELKGVDNQLISKLKASFQVANAVLHKSRAHFFEKYDDADPDPTGGQLAISCREHDVDVLVLWLKDISEKTEITLNAEDWSEKIQLDKLIKDPEVILNLPGVQVTCNLLFDKEIGEIRLDKLGINTNNQKQRFLVMADPQGGDPDDLSNDSPTRVKIHNAFTEESIELAKNLDEKPTFTVVIGDFVDSKGQRTNFKSMVDYHKRLNHPVLVECGNHETPYNAVFSPGYNMDILNNYFDAQYALSGIDKLLYSFNIGHWHCIVWPDPLRADFWPTHPHYFDWLEKDLDKQKSMPTLFLQHVPIHPIGINPLINYAESIEVKRLLLNTLSKHGNVKYILSGHVHIPLKAALKTAVEYKGMKLINLPASGYRPRAFGEEDFYGGPSQGFAIIDIDGDDLTLTYKNVTQEEFVFPNKLPVFDETTYPLWLSEKWELPAEDIIQNGNFSQGLTHWHRRYVYQESDKPSNRCEAGRGQDNKSFLYLFTRNRGYNTPGQDRMPQTINRICQAVKLDSSTYPLLSLKYLLDENFPHEYLAGAYLWIEGFNGASKQLNLTYSVGKMYTNIGGRYAQNQAVFPVHFDISPVHAGWNSLEINIGRDHDSEGNLQKFENAGINRLIINLGTWTINEGEKHIVGIRFTDLNLRADKDMPESFSRIENERILRKPESMLWHFRNKHTAGEHRYASQNELYPNGINLNHI